MICASTLWLYERSLDVPVAPASLPPGVELAVWDSLASAADAPPGWHPEAESRIRDGQACAVARHGRDIVSYCWLTCAPAWAGEIDRFVVPGPGDVYLYEAFTRPEWRGRALFPALLGRLVSFARARGRQRALIFVLSSNRPSRRAIERAGFARFAGVSRLQMWGRHWLWFRKPRSGRSRVTLVASEPAAARSTGPERAGERRAMSGPPPSGR
jgi:GNAT superfamily N-acetyltransferase